MPTPPREQQMHRRFGSLTGGDLLAIVCLGLLTFWGVLQFDQYGVTFDERAQWESGKNAYALFFEGDKSWLESPDRDYGIAFELPLFALQKWTGDENNFYEGRRLRHLVTHLFFLLSGVALYLAVRREVGVPWIALGAALAYFLHPRFYAHSYFNTKDIPFAAMVAFLLLGMSVLLRSSALLPGILFGAIAALTVNIRVAGVLFPLLIIVLLLPELIRDRDNRRARLRQLIGFTLSFALVLYGSWPILWGQPIEGLLEAFQNMAQFNRWGGSSWAFGQWISSKDVPWWYTFAWMGITTPLVVLVLGWAGTVTMTVRLATSGWRIFDADSRFRIFALAAFLTPVAAVVLFDSRLYNGWRQMYFIYPAFVVLAAFALAELRELKANYRRTIWFSAFGLAGLPPLLFVFTATASQHVFFNRLLPREPQWLRRNFEFDYWGASFRQGLDYVADLKLPHPAKTHCVDPPGRWNWEAMTPERRERIELVDDPAEAEFLISTYRHHPAGYETGAEVVYDRTVLGSSVVTVWRRPSIP